MRDLLLYDAGRKAAEELRRHGIDPIVAEDQWEAAELRSGHPEAVLAYGPALIPGAVTGRLRPIVDAHPRYVGTIQARPGQSPAKLRGVTTLSQTPPSVLLVNGLQRGGEAEALMQQAAAVLGVRYVLDLAQLDAVNFLRTVLLDGEAKP